MLTENWFQITIPALSQWSLLLSFFMVILNHLQKFFVYKIACLNEPHTIFIVCSCNHRKLAQICSSLFYVSKVIWAWSSISLLFFKWYMSMILLSPHQNYTQQEPYIPKFLWYNTAYLALSCNTLQDAWKQQLI